MANNNTYGGKFCNPDERQITTFGTSYLTNFISGGSAEQADVTLTNKLKGGYNYEMQKL
jgi:hypothetical protein